MKELGLEILNEISKHGYMAYIVGGFVRDSLLNIKSNDVDITTNAKPKELKEIFPNCEIKSDSYGSVILIYKNSRFDITTMREELEYLDNRHPSGIIYVNDLKTDLLRRDFTINALCFDKDGNLVDLIDGQKDIKRKVIKTIIDSDKSFKDDALRILRAIRFASYLDFNLSDEVKKAIINNKSLLKNLSFSRRKEELDKIFGSHKAKEGIKLIKEYQLDKELELESIERVKDYSDIVGIWAMIGGNKYNFSSAEKDLINKINIAYKLDNLDDFVLYKYGCYVNVIAGINKGLSKKEIIEKYESLPIKRRDEIDITAKEICGILNRKPGSFIGEIYNELEKNIIAKTLINEKKEIEKFILEIDYEGRD